MSDAGDGRWDGNVCHSCLVHPPFFPRVFAHPLPIQPFDGGCTFRNGKVHPVLAFRWQCCCCCCFRCRRHPSSPGRRHFKRPWRAASFLCRVLQHNHPRLENKKKKRETEMLTSGVCACGWTKVYSEERPERNANIIQWSTLPGQLSFACSHATPHNRTA